MFALGMVYWLFDRDLSYTEEYFDKKFGKNPQIAEANKVALRAGYYYAETIEALNPVIKIAPAQIAKGTYRNISGNTATSWGFLAAAEKAGLKVFIGSYPITPATGILEEMAAGATSRGGREGETFWCVADRGEAIRFAVKLAKPGDILLSCGKGHEQSMCFGETEFLWDDRTAMRAALSELLGVNGPPMPYLPSQNKPESEWLKS